MLPRSDEPLNLQIEPEVGVFCRIDYEGGLPVALRPFEIAAFNDCSIRSPNARKISEKKNWGAASKGCAATHLPVEELERDGGTASLRLASFLRRDGELHEYGVDSPLPGYSYYGTQLLDWIVLKLREQRDGGPLEDVGALLRLAGSPDTLLAGIGATRYTEFGEQTFLDPGDESIVAVYDSSSCDAAQLRASITAGVEPERSSVLVQTVVGP